MVSRIIPLLLLASAPWVRAELEFTPHSTPVAFEGVAYSQNFFRNGDAKVLYQPPGDWTMEGSGPKLTLRPAHLTQATATIESRPKPPQAGFDADTMQQFQATLAGTLPHEATEVVWAETEINPVLLNRHETRRLTVTYAAFAQRYTVTLVVCNFADQQVLFRLDTRSGDFEKAYDSFRRSLYTWEGLP